MSINEPALAGGSLDGASNGGQVLPNEILLHIAHHCDVRTLKALRLTSKLFHAPEVAAKLFEVVHLAMVENSIDHLIEISKAGHLKGLVHTVVFCGTRLRELDFELWFDSNSVQEHLGDAPDALHHFALYEELAHQQEALKAVGGSEEVDSALLRLPSLRSIEMEDITLSSEKHENSSHQNLMPTIGSLPSLEFESRPSDNSLPASHILTFLTGHEIPIQELKMVTNDFHGGIIGLDSYTAFRNIRTLSWTFVNPQYDNEEHPPWPFLAQVAYLIQNAKQLEDLRLDVDPSYNIEDFLSFQPMQIVRLEKLKVLHISFGFSENSLLSFIRAHASTLEELHFNKGILSTQTPTAWPPMLAKIPTVCKLKKIRFENIGNAPVTEGQADLRTREMLLNEGWRSRMVSHILQGEPVPTFDPEVWFAAEQGSSDDDYLDLSFLRLAEFEAGMSNERVEA